MTPEIEQMSAAVAQHFGWWDCELRRSGQQAYICKRCEKWTSCVPPPDLTEPQWFVRLLKTLDAGVLLENRGSAKWIAVIYRGSQTVPDTEADTPELALLKAAHELVKK